MESQNSSVGCTIETIFMHRARLVDILHWISDSFRFSPSNSMLFENGIAVILELDTVYGTRTRLLCYVTACVLCNLNIESVTMLASTLVTSITIIDYTRVCIL